MAMKFLLFYVILLYAFIIKAFIISHHLIMLQGSEALPQPCPSCGVHIKEDTYKEYLEVEEFTRHQLQIMKDVACILHMKSRLKSHWSNATIEIETVTLRSSLNLLVVTNYYEFLLSKLFCLMQGHFCSQWLVLYTQGDIT
jgi:hypothetical protein